MRILNKKIIASLLIITSIISSAGCGRSNASVEVSDYGPGGTDKSSKAKITSVDPGFDESEPIDISLDWDEELSYHNKDVSISIDENYHFMSGDIKQYTMSRVSDFKESESSILYELFGKSYKKLESISYVDGVKYMPFLYKYRTLIETFEKDENTSLEQDLDVTNQTFYDFIGNHKPLIDSSFSENYKWVDKENYYIHMYEGKYNNIDFGLILAYDNINKARYIYFKPISIDDYYPEKEIKTMELFNSVDNFGNRCLDNTCIYSEEEATNYIREFLTESLGMSVEDSELGYNYKVYSVKSEPIVGSIQGAYFGTEKGGEGISQITFSDTDYISTLNSYSPEFEIPEGMAFTRADAFPRSIELLAKQDDPAKAVDNGSGFMEYIVSGRYDDNTTGSGNFITDGYALYINPSFQRDFETNSGIRMLSDEPVNTGVIEITSKGILGADIIQMLDVENIQYKKLADMENVKATVRDVLTYGQLDDYRPDWEGVLIRDASLITYIDQDTSGIPAWAFSMQDANVFDTARIIINAETGEFVCFD